MGTIIAVAGGQGLIGKGVCESLLEGGRVDRVIALDLKSTGAIKGVEEKVVDVHNKAELVRILKDVDLVVNIVSPYYLHGTVVADAALEAGTHYTDACADVGVTEALLEQDERWKGADLTLMTGLGASPGIVNLLVAQLASGFDEVREAHVAWVVGGSDRQEEGGGTFRDFIKMEFGDIITFANGRRVTVKGFVEGAEQIQLGKTNVTVYHSGHSEPITIPRYFPRIRTVTCKGNVAPFGLSQLIARAVEIGLSSEDTIDVRGHMISPIEFLMSYALSPTALAHYDLNSLNCKGGMQVRVVGVRDGKEHTETVTTTDEDAGGEGGMTRSTAVPIAVVSEAIAHGEVTRRGAYAPEALDGELAGRLLAHITGRLRDT